MSIRMDRGEAWEFLAEARTGIMTSLRADGVPMTLPVWFALLDRAVYVDTRGVKLTRIRRDPRVAFLVEAGEASSELRAVHLTGTAQVIEAECELACRIKTELDRKYAAYRTPRENMPEATQLHYDNTPRGTVRIIPDCRMLSWDNRKL
jgi:nitroimidazol reductase NimA-like FMN-containing flavoprotein (pyridoxamine 5'-phosphate oxidase superfamily)